MNEHVGASFGLSVLIVLFFTVALYQPDKAPGPKAPVVGSKTAEVAKKTQTEPRAIATRSGPSPKTSAQTVSQRVALHSPRLIEASPGPPGAFTAARAGERLEDVAQRVYGDKGSTVRLWKANRDRLEREDEPLRTGMLVRTP